MSMVDRIKSEISKKGISIRALEIQCGFGNGTIRKWDDNSPAVDKVMVVANFLDMSVEYLITGKYPDKVASASNLTPGEQAIYEQVHPLSEPEKFKLAGALPFIRLLQDAPMSVPEAAREHAAIGLFVGSTSRD